MQHTQLNFAVHGTRLALVAVAFLLVNPALAGSISRPAPPDPLLDGGPVPACAAQPDFAAGTDAVGGGVAPADVAQAPVPVPDQIAVPLARGRGRHGAAAGADAYVSLDGRKLAPLLDPKPCR
ncbi:MAG TPA: hypothetical protein VG821_04435 [Rhizomicrobium sp.]|nr:hypothetical protein [Rhizomicrobium sp.]